MQIVTPRPVPAADLDTGALAHWLHGFTFEAIPPAVLSAAKAFILDTVAVAWAATRAAGMPGALNAVLAEGGKPLSTLWGSAERLGPGAAAFYNGALASAFDYDSFHLTVGHSDAVVVPAALAVAEAAQRDGRAVLAAYVAASELGFRLGRAISSTGGWFRTSTVGVFSASVAAAKLQDLNAAQIQHGLGIALGLASGTQQPHIERRLTKRLQPGYAARAGVYAAQLAAQGISGPHAPFDGQFGLYALYDAGDPHAAFADLGETYLLHDTGLKKFPTCACSHAAIQAALELCATHALDEAAIERIEIDLSAYANRLVGAPFSDAGDTEVTAQFSVRYAVAVALANGAFTLNDLLPEQVRSARIRALIERITLNVDARETSNMVPATVRVVTRDGVRHEHTVDRLPGERDWPLSVQERRQKAWDALVSGERGLSDAAAGALIERIDNLERVRDVAGLYEGLLSQ
ncbi:MAG: MmgE/PrpD family protein [Janthinobacterium lividum]